MECINKSCVGRVRETRFFRNGFHAQLYFHNFILLHSTQLILAIGIVESGV